MKFNIKLIVTVSILILLAAIVFILFFSPVFRIDYIDSDMAFGCSNEEISAAEEDFLGKNGIRAAGLFNRKLSGLEKKIMSENQYVERISISYEAPHILKIVSEAREISFLAEYYGSYLGIDNEGTLLENFGESDKPDLPLIYGIDVTDCTVGKKIFDVKDENNRNVVKLITLLKSYDFGKTGVSIIDLDDGHCVWMYFTPSCSVKFGSIDNSADTDEKIGRLLGILKTEEVANGTVTQIDLTAGRGAEFGN